MIIWEKGLVVSFCQNLSGGGFALSDKIQNIFGSFLGKVDGLSVGRKKFGSWI